MTQALKNSFWLREETERLLKVKPWITPVVVFSKVFVKFGRPVKGMQVVNKKFLLHTYQTGQGDTLNATTISINRERLANHLTCQETDSVSVFENSARFCPKCGKKLVEKTAKGGSQVGKRLWVYPDYPHCKTAIPIE